MKMKCPKCGESSGITDSRPAPYGIRRRHVCECCHHKFTTVEITAEEYKTLVDVCQAVVNLFEGINKYKGGAE